MRWHPRASQYLGLEREILGEVLLSALPGCWHYVSSGFPHFSVFSIPAALIFLGWGKDVPRQVTSVRWSEQTPEEFHVLQMEKANPCQTDTGKNR